VESTAKPPRFIRFAEYQLDTRTGELRNGAGPVQIHRQPLEVLLLLVKRAGDVVTREELRGALWPDQTFVDFEDTSITRWEIARGARRLTHEPPLYRDRPAPGLSSDHPHPGTEPGAASPPGRRGEPKGASPLSLEAASGIAVLVLGAFAAVILGLNVGGLRRLLQGSGALPALTPSVLRWPYSRIAPGIPLLTASA